MQRRNLRLVQCGTNKSFDCPSHGGSPLVPFLVGADEARVRMIYNREIA
jgi:hypothetical protein